MQERMTETEEEFDVPRLPRQGNYRDPNEPLPLDVEGQLQLTVNHFVSARTLILGQTGMGKGNAGALITEFLLEAGLPLTFIDLEGEGYSFKEVCPSLLVVGRSAHADREYSPAQMGRLAELSVEQGFSVVLDLSGYAEEEIFSLLSPYLLSLWETCDRLRTPYHLLLDEVHELVPEEGTTPVKSLLRRISKRGRKRGLGLIAMSQETASVDKKFLRQTDIRILLSVSYEADLKTYHLLIPGVSLETLRQTMPSFPPGKGYVIVKHQAFLVHLLRRRTFDPSETPKLGDQRIAPVLHSIDQQTLDIIDQMIPSTQSSALEGLDRATLIRLVRELREHQDVSSHKNANRDEHHLNDTETTWGHDVDQQQKDQKKSIAVPFDDQVQEGKSLAHPDVLTLLAQKDAEMRMLQEQIGVLTKTKVSVGGAVVSAIDLPSLLRVETLNTRVDQATIAVERVEGELPYQNRNDAKEKEADLSLRKEVEWLQAAYHKKQTLLEAKEKELQQLRKERKDRLASNQQQDSLGTFSEEQRIVWRTLMQTLATLKETQRAIVRVLLLYDGRGMTATEIAGHIHKASNTTTSNVPYGLINLGLIETHKQRNAVVYTARAQAYLHAHFPGKEKAVLSHVFALL